MLAILPSDISLCSLKKMDVFEFLNDVGKGSIGIPSYTFFRFNSEMNSI